MSFSHFKAAVRAFRAAALVFPLAWTPDARADDVLGQLRIQPAGENQPLADIALANGLGFVEMAAANPGFDPWAVPPGWPLVLPAAHILPAAERKGIVINVGDMRLYWFRPDGTVASFAIGIGIEGAETPLGATKVIAKAHRPTWWVPRSIRRERPELPASVPPGPDNPLGEHALRLGWTSYLIHGTNQPYGIGRRTSHGCIRMYPEDVARLHAEVPVGTRVTVVDQPIKLGWLKGELYLEAHPTKHQADEIEETGRMTPLRAQGVVRLVADALNGRPTAIDWDLVAQALDERTGLPVRITLDPTPPPIEEAEG
ncbi:MAG: L,D-transpeptidase family protein [Alphaproteobacteria bacterium]|nr:L,D-transpeptidase family protein [Alphaproteobacteria bacterium]